MGIVYQIRNRINNKVYVGQISHDQVWKRWSRHIWYSNRGSSFAIHNAIRKYGPENFDVWVLCSSVSSGHLDMLEQLHIKQSRSNEKRFGYNLAIGGKAPFLGRKHSREVKRKISRSLKGKYSGLSAWQYGKNLSSEHCRKISIGHKSRSKEERLKTSRLISRKMKGNQNVKGKHWKCRTHPRWRN